MRTIKNILSPQSINSIIDGRAIMLRYDNIARVPHLLKEYLQELKHIVSREQIMSGIIFIGKIGLLLGALPDLRFLFGEDLLMNDKSHRICNHFVFPVEARNDGKQKISNNSVGNLCRGIAVLENYFYLRFYQFSIQLNFYHKPIF